MRQVLLLAAFGLPLLAVPAFADCAGDVRAILDRSAAAGPYRAEMSTTMAGTKLTTRSEYVPSEAIRLVNTFNGESSELIVVGDRAWMNLGQGWEPMAVSLARQMGEIMGEPDFDVADKIVDPRCEGETAQDGRALAGYSFGLPDIEQRVRMLADPASGLPVEMRMPSGTGESIVRFTFDPSITIEPPPGF